MTVTQNCVNLIKKFEGCRLKAYKDACGVWTIGYGITNAVKTITGLTVKSGVTITQAQAEKMLLQVLNARYIARVTKYDSVYHWNQNQLDALTSFAYNIGSIDGLTNNGKRTIAQISAKIPSYNKAGGKVLTGLTRRRAAEKTLFDTPVKANYQIDGVDYSLVFDPTYYANRYADLKAVYGTNAAQLWLHFKTYGMKEGRQAIDTFNVITYKARYSDLQIAFGNNLPMYYRHYCVNGKNEGRQAI